MYPTQKIGTYTRNVIKREFCIHFYKFIWIKCVWLCFYELLFIYFFFNTWRYFSKKYGVDQPRQTKNISLSSDVSVNPLVQQQDAASKGRAVFSVF